MNRPTETELREWFRSNILWADPEELLAAYERAALGADLLDQVLEDVEHTRFRPAWWETIELDELDMGSSCSCILGQLNAAGKLPSDLPTHGEYYWGRRALSDLLPFNLDDDNAGAYGFDATTDPDDFHVSYRTLNAAWRWIIARRRAA